jgi:hypothetical protein
MNETAPPDDVHELDLSQPVTPPPTMLTRPDPLPARSSSSGSATPPDPVVPRSSDTSTSQAHRPAGQGSGRGDRHNEGRSSATV